MNRTYFDWNQHLGYGAEICELSEYFHFMHLTQKCVCASIYASVPCHIFVEIACKVKNAHTKNEKKKIETLKATHSNSETSTSAVGRTMC